VRADVEGVDTLLLRKRFIKSTLYRLPLDIDNIGIVSYNTMSVDDKDIYIRAALGKRIYTKGAFQYLSRLVVFSYSYVDVVLEVRRLLTFICALI
jgi:hypothetical protein